MSLLFSVESVESCWNELMVLANAHWAGTQSYRRHEPFNPSYDRYLACNQAGYFYLFTARDQGTLAGYFGVYVTPSMHSQLLMATEDTFFLHPDYRGGRNALRFLKHIEKVLQQAGVHEIMFSCEIDNETGIKGLLMLLDYTPVIMQYSKRFPSRPDRAQPSEQEAQHVGRT